jgi:hypothetical protein
MTATLKIEFEDGTSKEIVLNKAIEINIGSDRKQSIEFRETKNGEWVMAFTSPVLEGKNFKEITISKNASVG